MQKNYFLWLCPCETDRLCRLIKNKEDFANKVTELFVENKLQIQVKVGWKKGMVCILNFDKGPVEHED